MEQNVPIRIIQNLMGHSSITTTERYSHVLDDEKRKAIDRMSGYLPRKAAQEEAPSEWGKKKWQKISGCNKTATTRNPMKTAQNLFRFAALLPNDQENPNCNKLRTVKWQEKTRKAACHAGFWLRGEDLNLWPSGYEPLEEKSRVFALRNNKPNEQPLP